MPLGLDAALALAAFTFATSITPGPNNLMLMASGLNFGTRRTLPHLLGVGLGVMVMIVMVGAGAARAFDLWPALDTILRTACFAVVLWLAWKLWHAAPPGEGSTARGRPMRFIEAIGFQWVNPKAWVMVLTIVGVYAPDRTPATILAVACVFGLVNLPTVSAWMLAGTRLRRWLSAPVTVRRFNAVMAVLLVVSVLPGLLS